MVKAAQYVLWGFHPRMVNGTPIKICSGSLRAVNAAQRTRTSEGGWTLAIHAEGEAPVALRSAAASKTWTPITIPCTYGGKRGTWHQNSPSNVFPYPEYGRFDHAADPGFGSMMLFNIARSRIVPIPQPQGTIWVCEDCLQAEANGEEPEGRPDTEPEVWSLIPETTDVTMGLMTADHECDDPDRGESECDCERREFSWSACEGCGSTVGARRYAFTWWL